MGRWARISALLSWEFGETYRFPVLELIVIVIVVQIIGLGEPTTSVRNFPNVVLHIARVIDFSFVLGTIFLSVLVTSSIAGAFESRQMQLLASYPLARIKIIIGKILLSFLVFFVIYISILYSLFAILIPYLLLSLELLALLLFMSAYLLFFTSLSAFVSVVTRNTKISMLITILSCLGILLGLNYFILRGYTFLVTAMITFGEVFWEGFSYSSPVNFPFPPIVILSLLFTLVLLAITILHFNRVEV